MSTVDWNNLFVDTPKTFMPPSAPERLTKAAEEDNEEEFDLLLEETGEISIWQEIKQENVFCGVSGRRKPSSMLISKKRYYLNKIFKRYGLQNEVFGRRLCYIKELIDTDAPRIYTAILSGSVRLVELYLEYGAVLKKDDTADCIMQRCESRWENDYPGRSTEKVPAKYRREEGYSVRFHQTGESEEEGGHAVILFRDVCPIENSVAFHDPFTAAILSQSKEMIRFIADRLGDMEWNGCMEQSIVCSGLEITSWLLESFPEIIRYMSLRKIVEGKNIVLLTAFLKERETDLYQEWEEVKEFLHWYLEEAYRDQKKQCYWQRTRTGEEVRFYRKLFSSAPDEECRNLIIKMIFLEWFQAEQTGRRGCKSLQKLFCRLQKDRPQEYMKILFHLNHRQGEPEKYIYWGMDISECLLYLRLLNSEEEKLRLVIDLYNEEVEKTWGGNYEACRKTGVLFMKIFVPMKIEHKTDWFTRGLVRHGDIRLVKSAVRRGFITEKNADSLYWYAAEQDKPKEGILELLIELSQKTDLKERYYENARV